MSLHHRFVVNEQLIAEYVTFQADSAISYFQRNLALSKKMHSRQGYNSTAIELAYFYASTGLYYEAAQIISSVDTLSLSKPLALKYYIAQQKLNDELLLYSNDKSQISQSQTLATYYAKRILAVSEAETYDHLRAELWLAMQQTDYAAAKALTQQIMQLVPELSREWATAAFIRGLIAHLEGDDNLHMEWMIRSAIVDMRLGIRDYAALKSIASYCTLYDIERSMRYMRVMMEDVQAFNSRLRPWQDAMIWPEIEAGYHTYTEQVASEQRTYIYILIVLVIVAILSLIFAIYQNSRLREARRNMHEANERLNISVDDLRQVAERLTELNAQITEANGVKEEYIGIFLQVCSEYIDKLVAERRRVMKFLRDGRVDELRKELSATQFANVELKQFYNLFDSTFLRLYPTFVEELNSLLAKDSRIELRKGEYLNTELRIFALIRLGISDTPRIATLLHYSLSTIYNYRSRLRYNTGITREEFEKRLRTIGSFSR